MLHQGAALGREPLEVLEAQGDAADHELPFPIQAFAEGETAGFGGQFGFDGQAQATGQAAAEAGGQHHTHAHVPELAGGGAHQHKGFRWGELHGLRGGGINPPGNRFKHREGPAHALEKQFAGDGDGHFTHLQAPIPHRPDGTGRHAQAGIGFGLQAKAQLPELFAFSRGEQFEIGPGGGHLAGHRFAPMVGGDGKTLAVFFAEAEAAIALAQGFLPGRQEGIEAVVRRLIARPELAIEQGLQQACDPQAAAARPAAGQGWIAREARRQGTGGHLGQAGGQFFETAPVVFPVEQRQPAGLAGFDLGQPAAPGNQAQGPTLQVGPPAQVIGHFRMVAGQGQPTEPFSGTGRIEGPAIHLPGPPLRFFGDGFTGLQGQAAPMASLFGFAFGGLVATGQTQGGPGRSEGLRPQVVVVQPGGEVVLVEGEGVLGGFPFRCGGSGNAPGISP